MDNHFVSAHGGRGVGTSEGTFVVPPGLTIVFFAKDGTTLDNMLAIPLYDDLLVGQEVGVLGKAVRTYNQWDKAPNYKAYGANHLAGGDPVFQGYPTGVYRVGCGAKNPLRAIADGNTKSLEDIIYCDRVGKSRLQGTLYWLCCCSDESPAKIVQKYTPSSVASYRKWRD
ncbi:hypothetical protein DJ030_03845 [bacterium endosymbiont of Escarpia laminata]|nr:MAG: hypothetical protein DJ030_03845 [bacterium endosymbiont of Escarpia laminata]